MQTQYYFLNHIIFLYAYCSILALIFIAFIVTSQWFKRITRKRLTRKHHNDLYERNY